MRNVSDIWVLLTDAVWPRKKSEFPTTAYSSMRRYICMYVSETEFVCSCGREADGFKFSSSHDTCSLFMWMRPTEWSTLPRYQTAFIIQHPPPPSHHAHTLGHPSSTLESIDKQHKQQRGDKQGDTTKPCNQQDFNRRTIFQINIPKQRGVLVALQKRGEKTNLVQGVFDL